MTLPDSAGRVVLGATTVFLFAAPFAASGGVRAACLIVAALAVALSYRPREEAAAALPWALFAAFGAWSLLALASVMWTAAPRHTHQELRAETFYGALAFGAFFFAARRPAAWRVWWVALMLGTFLALAARALQQSLGLALWRHPPDGGVGPFSTHLVLVAPLLVALVCPPPWGLRRSAVAAALGIAAVIAAAWFSRDGWSTPNRIVWPALFAAFATAVLAGHRARGFAVAGIRGLPWTLALGALAIVIAFVAAVVAKSERFYPADPSMASSVERDLRPRLWQRALEEWKAAPWLGHGLGREIRAEAFIPETPPQSGHPPVRHGHNMLLNIAVQLGVAGVALFCAVLALLAREYWRYLGNPAVAPLGMLGLALVAGFLVKNLTDDFLHRHNAQVFWALNGLLVGFGRRAGR